jgi:hypothetical protein
LQQHQLVAHLGRLLEGQVAGVLQHLLLQPLDLASDVFLAHVLDARPLQRVLFQALHLAAGLLAVDAVDQVAHLLDDAARRDAVRRLCASCRSRRRWVSPMARFIESVIAVGIQDGLALQVAGGAADGLDQAALGAQEAFLVGVQDRDQRDLGNVQALRAAG